MTNEIERLQAKIEELEATLVEVRKAANQWEKAAQAASAALGNSVIKRMKANPKDFLPPKAEGQ
jgi:hypothetical protein